MHRLHLVGDALHGGRMQAVALIAHERLARNFQHDAAVGDGGGLRPLADHLGWSLVFVGSGLWPLTGAQNVGNRGQVQRGRCGIGRRDGQHRRLDRLIAPEGDLPGYNAVDLDILRRVKRAPAGEIG